MPSKSKKQHRFMEAIAHGMKPKSGKGPSPYVAREFIAADARKRKSGGKGKR
jgi:hypothetical protein